MILSVRNLKIFAVGLLLVGANVVAAPSGKGGNGFPPGTHFNLNVIAKWSERDSGNFTCPSRDDYQYDLVYLESITGDPCDPETYAGVNSCDLISIPSDRNVIFIPRETSAGQQIDIISGGKGNKATAIEDKTKLEVTDWCTQAFDDSRAAFFLPENKAGYEIYARLVGKPRKVKDGEPVSMTLIPDIEAVSTECEVLDENSQPTGVFEPCELLHIGTLDSDGITVKRSGDGSSNGTVKGKGVNKAVEVTDLFLFTGHVCLRPEPGFYDGLDTSGFCLDEAGSNICSSIDICCTGDSPTDNDLLFDSCGYLSGADDPTVGDALTAGDGFACDAGRTMYTVDCQGPFVSEWAFNIADIVDYFLDVQNNGGYVLQLRFYPQ